jgi:hypothetical protein
MSLLVLLGSLLVYSCTALSTGSQPLLSPVLVLVLLEAALLTLLALADTLFCVTLSLEGGFCPEVALKSLSPSVPREGVAGGASPVDATAANVTLVMAASRCAPNGVPTIILSVPPGSARSKLST